MSQPQRVIIHGHRDDLYSWIQITDALASTSPFLSTLLVHERMLESCESKCAHFSDPVTGDSIVLRGCDFEWSMTMQMASHKFRRPGRRACAPVRTNSAIFRVEHHNTIYHSS
jgi:hypothetical protein